MKRWLGIALLLAWSVGTGGPAEAADIVGRGSLGASGGGVKFFSGDDLGEGEMRLIGNVQFKYNFTNSLAGVFESGWGWNAFPTPGDEDDTLAVVAPTTFGLEYRFRAGQSSIWPHVAAGGGFYFLGVKDGPRKWARDAVTNNELTWVSPGIYGKVGAELLFENAVSINLDFLYHHVFAEDSRQFPAGWGNENASFGQVRLGVNYYFRISGPDDVESDISDDEGDLDVMEDLEEIGDDDEGDGGDEPDEP